MAEPQLIDYIKKAKAAGQTDEQTRTLLRQNGWTDEEINESFSAVSQPESELPVEPPVEPVEPETQPRLEHQVSGQPQINVQRDSRVPADLVQDRFQSERQQQEEKYEEPQSLYSEEPKHKEMPKGPGVAGLILKILVTLVLLIIIGAGIYFVLFQGDFLQNIVNKTLSYFSPTVKEITPSEQKEKASEKPPAAQKEAVLPAPETKKLATILSDYDIEKISVIAYSQNGDKVVYCAPLKIDVNKVSCFLNGEKFLDNPYVFKPYWIGISPNGKRIIFLYYNSVGKESFSFENGIESKRYDGIITSPVFSSDSKNFMYVVMGNDGKSFVVLNGKQSNAYDKIFTAPELSSDGKYILYGARNGENIMWVADEIKSLTLPSDEQE